METAVKTVQYQTKFKDVIWEILVKFAKYDELCSRFYTEGIRFDVLKFEGILTIFADQEEILIIHDSIQKSEVNLLNFSIHEKEKINLFNVFWNDKFSTDEYKNDYANRISEHINYIAKKHRDGFKSVRTVLTTLKSTNTTEPYLRIKYLDVFLIDLKNLSLGTDYCSNRYGYRLIYKDEVQAILSTVCRSSLELLEDELAEISGTMLKPTI